MIRMFQEGMEEDTEALVNNIVRKGIVSEQEMKLIMGRINQGRVSTNVVQSIWDDPPEVEKRQFEKGYQWLLNLWKSPTGVERRNNPFGYREQEILENAEGMIWKGIYSERGNFWVPLYEIYSNRNSMEYYVSGGQVNVIG